MLELTNIAPPTLPPAQRLDRTARAFETVILSELLKASGAGATNDAFGGGIGEEQFASFLVAAQAERIAHRGGIGIAEMILRSLPESPHDEAG